MTDPKLETVIGKKHLETLKEELELIEAVYPKFNKENYDLNRAPALELTYNWDPEVYDGGRNFGHLAFRVKDIYALCKQLLHGEVSPLRQTSRVVRYIFYPILRQNKALSL